MIADELAAWAHRARGRARPGARRRAAPPARRRRHGVGGLRSGAAAAAVEVARGLGGPPEATRPRHRRSGSARPPPRSRTARSCTRSTSTTPTPAGWCTPPPSCCRRRSRSASRSARPARGARRGRGRLRDGLPGRRRRPARASTPAACTPPWSPASSPRPLVAARLLGLDAARRRSTRWASPAARPAGCWRSCTPGRRPSSCTRASRRTPGILAARLAAAGASGPANVFDGPDGLYDALADRAGRPRRRSSRGSASRWETTRIGIKPYPACQLSHAALDAVRDALRRGGFGAADVAEIEVDVHPDSAPIVCAGRATWPGPPRRTPPSSPCRGASRRCVLDGDVTTGTYAPESHRPAGGGGARPAGRGGR